MVGEGAPHFSPALTRCSTLTPSLIRSRMMDHSTFANTYAHGLRTNIEIQAQAAEMKSQNGDEKDGTLESIPNDPASISLISRDLSARSLCVEWRYAYRLCTTV